MAAFLSASVLLLCLFVVPACYSYSAISSEPSPFRDRRFFKVAKVVYQSPYSGPEVTCRGSPCTVLACAQSCEKEQRCVVFSHNPARSTCVFSRRPDDDAQDYEVADPEWNTYYTRCPGHAGYHLYGHHHPPLCLHFHLGQVVGDVARQTCVQEQADLVRVKTLQVLSTVQTLLSDVGTDNWVWIGADDTQVEGQFVWNDGTPLPRGTTLWDAPGEGGDQGEDCTALSQTRKIIDDGCFWEASFLCQYDV